MAVSLFTQIVDKIRREIGPGAPSSIALYNWGEPLLHPDLPTLIQIAKERGFGVMLSSNLNRPRDLPAVVAAGPAFFRVSVSGSANDSYRLTHRGGDVTRVVKNMRALRDLMDRCGATFHVQVMYHVYLHNTGEDLERMRTLCEELRFAMTSVPAFLMPLEKNVAYRTGDLPLADREIVARLAVSPEEADEIVRPLATPGRDCELRADQLTINFDGSVALCCATYTHPNVSKSFLEQSIADLQVRRYADRGCELCMGFNLDLSTKYLGASELQKAVNRNVAAFRARAERAAMERPARQRLAPGDRVGATDAPRRLALCVVVRDEAERLDRCLDSVGGLADEIVVIDTGSVDGTQELARRRGATVVSFPWRDDFGAARNEALRHVTAPFVLVLDADEVLETGAADTLQQLLDQADLVAAHVAVTNLAGDGFRWQEWPIRLVRRFAGLSYAGRAFATPDASIADAVAAWPSLRVAKMAGPGILHDGLLPELGGLHLKRVRNLHLVRIEMLQQPDDLRLQFLRARELGAEREGFELAVATARRLLASGAPLTSCSFAPVLLAMAARGAGELGLFDDADSFLESAGRLLPRCPALSFARAQILLKRGRRREALQALPEVLAAPSLSPEWEQERTDAVADAVLALVSALWQVGMLAQALEAALLARQLRSGSTRLLGATLGVAVAAGKPGVALEQLARGQQQGLASAGRLRAWGDAAAAAGNHPGAEWFHAQAAAARV